MNLKSHILYIYYDCNTVYVIFYTVANMNVYKKKSIFILDNVRYNRQFGRYHSINRYDYTL